MKSYRGNRIISIILLIVSILCILVAILVIINFTSLKQQVEKAKDSQNQLIVIENKKDNMLYYN